MRKIKVKKKITRKEIKKPDQFITTTTKIYNYAKEHKKPILSIAVGILFAGILTYAIFFIKEKRLLTASSMLYKAELAMNSEIEGAEYSEETAKLLKDVMEHYSGSVYGKRARYMLAKYMIKHNRYEEAEELLKFFKDNTENVDVYLLSSALETLGWLLEKKGDYLSAGNIYMMITELGPNPLGVKPYEDAGRCFEKIGNFEEAIKVYNEAIAKYPRTPRTIPIVARLKKIYLNLQK